VNAFAAIAAFIAAAVLLILGGLGLAHARRVPPAADILAPRPAHAPTPGTVTPGGDVLAAAEVGGSDRSA
jgi:hypothetical protein